MKLFLIVIISISILYLLYKHLLEQSKRPHGWIGIIMMRLWNNVYLPIVKWCLSFVQKNEFRQVLDVGIGNGATTKYISTTFTCQSIIRIDISEKAIEQASSNHLNSTISFAKKDIQNTHYPSNHFDFICAFQNHFHWNNLQESLSEIRRILSDDGIFLIGCEYSKIRYYLPNLTSEKEFKTYLLHLNLNLVQVEYKKDWIFYKILPAE